MVRWLDSITNSMGMNLRKLWEIVKETCALAGGEPHRRSRDLQSPLRLLPWRAPVSHTLSKTDKHLREKRKARALISGEMTSGSLTHRELESSKEKRDRQKNVLKN